MQFTHLLCFAKCGSGTLRVGCGDADGVTDLGSTIPDVVARGSKPGNLRKGACCMGVGATAAVVKWAQRRLKVETVIDPFCGAGTVLAVANAYGLHAIGVDISPKRIRQAIRGGFRLFGTWLHLMLGARYKFFGEVAMGEPFP